jgi:uncharacterized protein
MNSSRWVCIAFGSLLMTSCASTPTHYHTLVPAPTDEVAASTLSAIQIEIEPVRVPAQVDRLELVVRRRDGGIVVADGELWIGPLADELRSALSVEIVRELGTASNADFSGNLRAISIRLDVEQFESAPAQYAMIEASWRVRVSTSLRELVLTCRSRVYERVSTGYIALVRGHQRAIISLADRIGAATRGLATDNTTACPAT